MYTEWIKIVVQCYIWHLLSLPCWRGKRYKTQTIRVISQWFGIKKKIQLHIHFSDILYNGTQIHCCFTCNLMLFCLLTKNCKWNTTSPQIPKIQVQFFVQYTLFWSIPQLMILYFFLIKYGKIRKHRTTKPTIFIISKLLFELFNWMSKILKWTLQNTVLL